MEEQTAFTPKPTDQAGIPQPLQTPQQPTESHYRGITVRAWLAICLIGAVVLHSVAVMAVVLILVLEGRIEGKDAVALLAVTEPLYTMAGMALAYYFGQQKMQGASVTQPTKQ